jgi:hypothetical protein
MLRQYPTGFNYPFANRLSAVFAPGTGVTAICLRLMERYEMFFTIADQIRTAHGFERLAQ